MSRRDEVENEIDGLDIVYSANFYTDSYADLARTLAAEVDAITAERDEWKRRLDAVVKDLEPKQGPPNPTNPTAVDVAIWRESRSIHRRIIAIAEGRDNG